MALVTARGLARQLHGLLPRLAPEPDPGPSAERRILDAALEQFSQQGVRRTTMSQLAREAGISREWLYRHFRNRDAIVIAVTRREVARLIDGLADRAVLSDDVQTVVADAFCYAVEFLRDHALLQSVIRHEPRIVTRVLLDRDGTVLSTAVEMSVTYLTALAEIEPDRATVIAETLVRLAVAITVAPRGRLDLRDGVALRAYADAVAGALLAPVAVGRR